MRKYFALNKFIDFRAILPRTSRQPNPPPQEGFFLPLHKDEIKEVNYYYWNRCYDFLVTIF